MRKILNQFISKDISNLILDYAFKHTYKKELFELGDYKKCKNILKNISKWKLEKDVKWELYNALFSLICKGGHVEIAKLLQKQFTEPMNLNTGFLDACQNGRAKMAQYILSNSTKIKINGFVYDGFCKACIHDHLNLVEFLSNNYMKASPLNPYESVLNSHGYDPTDRIREYLFEESVKYADEHDEKIDLIHEENINKDRRLLSKIFGACHHNQIERTRMLLTIKNNTQWGEVLKFSCRICSFKTTKALVEIINKNGYSVSWDDALIAASYGRNTEIVKLMIENKASIRNKSILLYCACRKAHETNNRDLMDYLDNLGARWNPDILHYAVYTGKLLRHILKRLLVQSAGFSWNRILIEGSIIGNLELVKIAILNVSTKKESIEDGIRCACKSGNLEVINYLLKKYND